MIDMHWGLPCSKEMLESTMLHKVVPQAPLQRPSPRVKNLHDNGPDDFPMAAASSPVPRAMPHRGELHVPAEGGREVASVAVAARRWETGSRGLAAAVFTIPTVGDDDTDNRYVGEVRWE
jgi:hypothetical protein